MRREWIEIVFSVTWRDCHAVSPSMRREWIEMFSLRLTAEEKKSPSMRREWIEIKLLTDTFSILMSPSMRREWIEIQPVAKALADALGLPPCGGSGLKFLDVYNDIAQRLQVSLHAEGVD